MTAYTRTERELLTILAIGHRRMDEQVTGRRYPKDVIRLPYELWLKEQV